MNLIRKISIGPDLLKAMNYSVGQPMLGAKHTIAEISKTDSGSIDIWLQNSEEEVFIWKTISPLVPVTIEYNIEY